MTTHGSEPTVRHGVVRSLEDEADRIIYESLKGVTSMSAKSDVLTPWKQKNRLEREVYSRDGVPDEATRKGMYHRAWNRDHPHLNSRDGLARGSRFASAGFGENGGANEEANGLGVHLGDMGFDS